jgi:hypothetical protein
LIFIRRRSVPPPPLTSPSISVITKEEIREIFLHAAVYCGAPAALESFRIAKEVFAEDGV